MGSDRHYPEERPAHRVSVDGFWIDRYPVTNARFARFVEATGHVTFAEKAPDPAQYPGALPDMLYAGSLVFAQPAGPVDLRNMQNWWTFLRGADWRHPHGPATSLDGLEQHPVVHVTFGDAEAFATWEGKSLPTEAEWELAARGGLEGADYAWGDTFLPGDRHMANTWQGQFPWQNLATDGYEGTSPVGAFPANGYGLHDMIGNVWEWTTDWYVAAASGRGRQGLLHAAQSARTAGSARATIPASRRSGFHARSSRAARTSARPTTAAATGRPRASRNRSTRRPAISASAACVRPSPQP